MTVKPSIADYVGVKTPTSPKFGRLRLGCPSSRVFRAPGRVSLDVSLPGRSWRFRRIIRGECSGPLNRGTAEEWIEDGKCSLRMICSDRRGNIRAQGLRMQ